MKKREKLKSYLTVKIDNHQRKKKPNSQLLDAHLVAI
jgi:hypothetical protein